MGKCTRKLRTSGDVSAMDASQSSLGVHTRAKILALQRLQSSSTADASPQPPMPEYLELRSRRLEKVPPVKQYVRNSRNTSSEQSIGREDEENPRIETSPEKPCSGSGFSVWQDKDEDGCFEKRSGGFEIDDLDIEVSYGENNLDMEVRERTTRESTPCSLIRTADTITIPGSSTKHRTPMVANHRPRDTLINIIPTVNEIEEFFSLVEQPHERHFVERYNFDILNDVPLPGRYEWVRVTPCSE